MTFQSRMREALLALMARRHTSPTATARKMGRGQQYLIRKLSADNVEQRPLTVTDVDETLQALGATPEELVQELSSGIQPVKRAG